MRLWDKRVKARAAGAVQNAIPEILRREFVGWRVEEVSRSGLELEVKLREGPGSDALPRSFVFRMSEPL